jgi:hypothetical protein
MAAERKTLKPEEIEKLARILKNSKQ